MACGEQALDLWDWDEPIKGESAGVPKPPLSSMRTGLPNW
jgi:hypothetical protein